MQILLVLQAFKVFIVRAFKVKSILLAINGLELVTYKYQAILCTGIVEQCHIMKKLQSEITYLNRLHVVGLEFGQTPEIVGGNPIDDGEVFFKTIRDW